MASREERLQGKLRGGQRRQVADYDFGLAIHTAPSVLPGASSRRTPQPDEPQTESPPQRSTRRTPGANDANISAKRRKLDTDALPSSSERRTRSSQPKPRPDESPRNDDEGILASVEESAEISNISIEQSSFVAHEDAEPEMSPPPSRKARTPSMPRMQEEVTESPMDAPGSGRRARVSILEASIASSHLQAGLGENPSIETPAPQNQRKRKREAAPRSRSRQSQGQSAVDELDELSSGQPEQVGRRRIEHSPQLEDADELSPEQAHPRRKKKAIPSSPVMEQPDKLSPEQSRVVRKPDEEDEAEAIDGEQAAVLLKKIQGRRRSRNAPVESPDLDSPQDSRESVLNKQRSKSQNNTSSPVKQRHPKQQSRKHAKKQKVRIGSPIPVTVHRLTKAPIYEVDEAHADILNAEVPRTKRGGVNAIDVLSQICQEIVGAGIDTLEQGWNTCDDLSLRREYRTKLRAVEAFGDELDTRLLEHTINLDNSYSLERRLRDEQKKKLGLREEILRIRAEREQVALKMDDVRIKHEHESKTAQEKDCLNATVHDIELAVDLGKSSDSQDRELTGTELLLKRIADDVSSESESGGILRQIKEFNAFLERAALALESRKN